MTFAQLWNALKITWRSRPFAILLPLGALFWYFWTHGHKFVLATENHGGSLPTWQEFIAGAALLTTKFERVTEFFLGTSVAPAQPPPNVGGAKLPIVLLLGLALGVNSCATTLPPNPTPVQTLDYCSTSALQKAGASLIGDLAAIFAAATSPEAVAVAIAPLATQFGIDEVRCGVQLFVSEFQHRAAVDSLAATQETRAKAWLATQAAP